VLGAEVRTVDNNKARSVNESGTIRHNAPNAQQGTLDHKPSWVWPGKVACATNRVHSLIVSRATDRQYKVPTMSYQ
jgi:hypothetical protein